MPFWGSGTDSYVGTRKFPGEGLKINYASACHSCPKLHVKDLAIPTVRDTSLHPAISYCSKIEEENPKTGELLNEVPEPRSLARDALMSWSCTAGGAAFHK